MRSFYNAAIWVIALVSGTTLGLLMVPIELFVNIVALILGAKDVRIFDVGFVLRQFTDLRYLREAYPIHRKDQP